MYRLLHARDLVGPDVSEADRDAVQSHWQAPIGESKFWSKASVPSAKGNLLRVSS